MWMQNKSHLYVQESRTFSKGLTWCKLTITLIRRALSESKHELILGHSPSTLTTRVVRKLYPRNLKHIRNKLWCDTKVRTSNANEEVRYWTINSMHVEVKLLYKHGRIGDWDIIQWLLSSTVNDIGKVDVGEVRQNNLAFRMNASSRKVLRESLLGILITKLNIRRSRIRGRRCPRTKRVPRRSRLAFRCHRHY